MEHFMNVLITEAAKSYLAIFVLILALALFGRLAEGLSTISVSDIYDRYMRKHSGKKRKKRRKKKKTGSKRKRAS